MTMDTNFFKHMCNKYITYFLASSTKSVGNFLVFIIE